MKEKSKKGVVKIEMKSVKQEYVADNNITTELIPYHIDTLYRSRTQIKIEATIKRTIDIIGSIFGLILLIPLSIAIYIANYISGDKGPLFYTQTRIGKIKTIFNRKWRSKKRI